MQRLHVGTSQTTRIKESQSMSSFKMDDRSFTDLLYYILLLTRNIKYYNKNNEPDGPWSQLLKSSSIFYMIEIICTDTSTLLDSNDSYDKPYDILKIWDNIINSWSAHLFELSEPALANRILELLSDEGFSKQRSTEPNFPGTTETHEWQKPIKGNTLLFAFNLDVSNSRKIKHNLQVRSYLKLVLHIQNLTKDYIAKKLSTSSNTRPDIAMYIAIAELYKKLQANINQLPAKHLDLYYRDILKQTSSAGIPTRAYLCFELKPKLTSTNVLAGSLVSAGKCLDDTTEIFFKTTRSLNVINTTINNIRTLFVNKNPILSSGTKNKTVTNVQLNNLITAPGQWLRPTNGAAPLFGATLDSITDVAIHPSTICEIGFVISSNALLLMEGNRYITINLFLNEDDYSEQLWNMIKQIVVSTGRNFDTSFHNVFDDAFILDYTSSNGWTPINAYEIGYDIDTNLIYFTLHIDEYALPLVPCSSITSISGPSLKFRLNPYATTYAYSFINNITLNRITLNVAASGISNFPLYNNIGKIHVDKPYDLFGPIPNKNDYIIFGCEELLNKVISNIELTINWNNLPTNAGGFSTYYANYPTIFNNDSFKLLCSQLDNGKWNIIQNDLNDLFESTPYTPGNPDTRTYLKAESRINPIRNAQVTFDQKPASPKPFNYNPNTKTGFFKLTLCEPDVGFGSKDFQTVQIAIAKYNAINNANLDYPNNPFVPKVNKITLAYTADDEISFNQAYTGIQSKGVITGSFTHITPFGTNTIASDNKVFGNNLIENISEVGYLILSLDKVQYNTPCSIYFELSGTGDPTQLINSKVIWEYLQFEKWIPIPDTNILSDSTNGLVKSGIIELILPENGNTPSELYWIRAYATGNPECYPLLAGVYLNAVESECTSSTDELVGKTIHAGSAKTIIGNYPDINAVIQPTNSFGGRVVDNYIYAKVRERLRHKNRAITLWDYERLALELFPDIAVAKCTNLNKNGILTPGKVTLLLLSKQWIFQNQHYFNVDTLYEINQKLKPKLSPFVELSVINPELEYLIVKCEVTFTDGDTGGYFINLLNNRIIDFLSPISRDIEQEGAIGRTTSSTMLISYLENLPYVETINKLYIEHIFRISPIHFKMTVYKQHEVISPNSPYGMLVPIQNNVIISHNNKKVLLQDPGIGTLEIGQDFIINAPFDDSVAGPETNKSTTPSNIKSTINNAIIYLIEKKEYNG